ncbi:MAG: amidase [Saprospirales bacterium]|nr:MAG: amidase [Saprospirales bacterium]
MPFKKSYHFTLSILCTLGLLLGTIVFSACEREVAESEVRVREDFPLLEMQIADLQEAYMVGNLTVVEVVQLYLDRIEELDKNGPCLNSVIALNPEALETASQLDDEISEGNRRGPMHGVPVMLKDNIDTSDGMPSTAGSRALKNNLPDEDAAVVKKLREAGAVIMGKTNLSEWANFRGTMSSSGWSGHGGQTLNPYYLDRNPCGSSSGSGVAVSANLTMVAIGTETNGSIVCPSHANGVVGLKPTSGLVSNAGIIPIAFSMDVAGPMTRTVRDAALTLDAMTDQNQNSYAEHLDEFSLEGKRIGYYTSHQGRNFKVDSLTESAIAFLESRGAEIIYLDQIVTPKTAQHAFEVMLYEYKTGLNKYLATTTENTGISNILDLLEFNEKDDISLRYFNQSYLEMVAEKEDLDAETYLEALHLMHFNSREMGIDLAIEENELEAIMAPTGSPAWLTDLYNGDAFQFGTSSPAAFAGYPIISVPMGQIHGLPVGISFFGSAYSEKTLLGLAHAFEQGTRHREPPLFLPNSQNF